MKTAASLTLVLLVCWPAAAPAQEIHPNRTYPRFAVGVTGIYATIEPGKIVTVQDIAPKSPADGKLQPGDVLVSADGKELDVADPRVPLGEAVGRAEAKDGALPLAIRRGEETVKTTLTLPVLGAYSATWPVNCAKSDAIVKANAEFLARAQLEDGSYKLGGRPERDGLTGCLAGLFLLSTGEADYLPNVRLQARKLAAAAEQRPTNSTWHLGYQGILLAEYYLRTGDRQVLPGLKSLCDRAIETQAAGAWGHGGSPPNPGYVQSGLMNSAGVPVLTTLILARECGVAVDEEGFVRSLKFFYRMAGHGNVCYGDHRAELWWPNTNGRNAMLACGLSLLDETRYQQAARHLALLVADSYYKPEFGHTGGGFNVVWRGMGSVHVPNSRRSHYHRQMNKLAWYYDLCRQPGGGFSMLPSPPDTTRYTGLAWGSGAVGLTYTAPRRTLRITGAPRTRYSVPYEPPAMEWGSDADLVFLSTEDAAGFGAEQVEPHEVYARLIGKEKEKATVEFCAKHLRHYSPMVRTWAARWLNEHPGPQATRALAEAVDHPDPRVRRAVYDSVSGYDNWGRPFRANMSRATVSSEFLPEILKTINTPDAAWWEIDGALFALGRAQPDDIRRQLPIIKRFSGHEEWYLREAAFWALDGLREAISREEFRRLAELYADESHVFARTSYDAGFRAIVKDARLELPPETLLVVAKTLGPTLHHAKVTQGYDPAGGRHEAAHRTMMILRHFDSRIYGYMIDDFVAYLDTWEPYYQHSVWLIIGSNWQPGILKVLDGLGEDGRPICIALMRVVKKYPDFDQRRIDRNARALPQQIRAAVETWERKHEKIDQRSPR